MKPRVALSEGEHPLVLATTYSFDPMFFERLVMPAVRSGGAADVLVLADAGEVRAAFERETGPLHQLGRRYLLQPVETAGAFHPKLVVRFSTKESGGHAWLSSGNLTYGGWGLNRESAVAWSFGPGETDTGGWVRPWVEDLRARLAEGLAERVLGRIDELSWLPLGPEGPPPVLFSGAQTLAMQVAARWPGRRFEELRFLTGSTDATGGVLEWFGKTFGVQRAVGAVTPSWVAWRAPFLDRLAVDVALIGHVQPTLHAKAYHLRGPDGDVLLLGSANCTPAGWLRPAAEGGNLEALAVYEAPTAEDLAFLDEALTGSPEPPAAVLVECDLEADEASTRPAPALQIASFVLEEEGGVALRLAPEPLAGEVWLVVGEEEVRLEQAADGEWLGQRPEWVPPGMTLIGHVEVRAAGQPPVVSGSRWADDLSLLHAPSGLRRLQRVLGEAESHRTSSQQDQMLEELVRLAREIREDRDMTRDPFRRRETEEERGDEDEETAPPVDPAAMIVSLGDDADEGVDRVGGVGGGLSLRGVYAMLFGRFTEDEPDDDHELGVEDQEREAAEAGHDEPDELPPEEVGEKAQKAARRRAKKFKKHMDEVVADLGKEAVRERCTATQLKQMAGYALAVGRLGVEMGWVEPDEARTWLVETATAVLRAPEGAETSLLEAVQARYENDGEGAKFRQIVGDGLLFVTMAAGLTSVAWPGRVGALERLVLLRDLWRAEVLRADVDDARMDLLVRRYRAGEAVEMLGRIAGPVLSAVARIERVLGELCEDEDMLDVWFEEREPVQAGDLLWGPGAGWGLAMTDESNGNVEMRWPREGRTAKLKIEGFLIAVAQSAELAAELEEPLDQLTQSWAQALVEMGEAAEVAPPPEPESRRVTFG